MKTNSINIIPMPSNLELGEGKFELSNSTEIIVGKDSDNLKLVAKYLADQIKTASGHDLKISISQSESGVKNSIFLT